MKRPWLLPTVLAVAVLLGLVALARPSAPELAPVAPMPSTDPVVASERGADPAHGGLDPEAPPPRVAVDLAGGADEPDAQLLVHVVHTAGGGRSDLAFAEVALQTGATTLRASTDASGRAAFVVRGGHGRSARVRCALGAEQTLTLTTAETSRVELVVLPKVLVRGVVRDTTGQPVPGAALLWLPWTGFGDEAPAEGRAGRARADGSFELAAAVGGHVGAWHPAHGPSAMFLVQPPSPPVAPPPVQTVELLLLAAAGQITGIVRGPDGAPLADAELEFRSVGGAPPGAGHRAAPQRVVSDANGRYTASRLLPGRAQYAARARGCGPARGELVLDAARGTTLDVQLPPACEVRGTVRFVDGAPAAGALVASGDGFGAGAVRADANGAFLLAELAPGANELRATARRSPGEPALTARTTLVLEPRTAGEWHAELAADGAPPNLRGDVVDQAGRALAGWRVVARAPGSVAAQATTAADGAFALRVPANLRVDLRVYAPARNVRHFADAVRRAVDPGAGSVRIQVPPPSWGRIVGRVTTHEQAPVPAVVACWHHERAEHVRFHASELGLIRLDEVPAGTLDLQIEHPRCVSHELRNRTLRARDTDDLGTVVLGAGGVLRGEIRWVDGTVPTDCQLTLLATSAAGRTQPFLATYSNGTYVFPTVPPGEHALLVQGTGFAAQRWPVTIEANVDKTQSIQLRGGVSRRFVARIPPEAPATIALGLQPVDAQGRVWVATGTAGGTGAERTVEFTAWVAPGEYEAVAWAGEQWIVRRRVQFVADDDTPIDLRLQHGGRR